MPKSTSAPARRGDGRPTKVAAGDGRATKAAPSGPAAKASGNGAGRPAKAAAIGRGVERSSGTRARAMWRWSIGEYIRLVAYPIWVTPSSV